MEFTDLLLNPENWLLAFAATATVSVVLQNLLLVAVALWLFLAWKKGVRPSTPRSLFAWATLAFMASFLLSAALGVNPSNSFHSVHKYLILLMLFPVAAMDLRGARALRPLYAFTAGTSVCAVWGITKHLIGREERIRSFSGHYMVFGGLLMLAVLLGAHFIRQNPRDRWSWLFLALNVCALVMTQTRGAWLGFAVGFVLWAGASSRKLLAWGLAGMAVLFLLVPTTGRERLFDILRQNDRFRHSSDMERTYIWRAGLGIIRDYPVFGIGHGNMEMVYPNYKVLQAMEPNVAHLHDNFLQIAAQNGLVGLAVFLFWLAAYFRAVLRAKPPDPSDASLHFTLTCLFISSMVWGLTEYTFSHQFMSVQAFLLGIQMSLIRPAGK